ncbi:Zn-dependent protease [Planctomycetota bacterium]|nr:Zn-dependent protease [Planctomycetota bacterium]
MNMDFFGQQDIARRKSSWLIAWFALAVISIVITIYLAAAVTIAQLNADQSLWQPQLALSIGIIIPLLIGAATLVRIAQLRSGGSAVAQMLGGTMVSANSEDPLHRVLCNVVEEMAIAAGIPAPTVFVLENEIGINAFAAGYSTADAAITVTRGCLLHLDREQLQGVIAHEFSHVLHGDMRLNIRLIGVLFGIICLSHIGLFLVRTTGGSYRRDRKGNQGLVMFGFALLLIGSVGAFMSGLIKAALSRQREFLADASAVVYTRNPRGIGTALAKIADQGSLIESPRAFEASHMFFADVTKRWFFGLTATHPPIQQRIERVLPGFLAEQVKGGTNAAAANSTTAAQPKIPGYSASVVANLVGTLTAVDLASATQVLAAMPLELLSAAHDPSRVQGLLYALLLPQGADAQAQSLRHLEPATAEMARSMSAASNAMSRGEKLAMLEVMLPALRQQPATARQQIIAESRAWLLHDETFSSFEFAIWKTVQRHLSPPTRTSRREPRMPLAAAHEAIETILSLLAHSAGEEPAASNAFTAGASILDTGKPLHMRPATDLSLANIERALDQLMPVSPFGKRQLVTACARAVSADGTIRADEGDLMRALVMNFGCPMPPLQGRCE